MSPGAWSGVITGVLMLAFIAGVGWVWSSRRHDEFDEAARLPLEDEAEAVEPQR